MQIRVPIVGNVETNTEYRTFCYPCGNSTKYFDGRCGGISKVIIRDIDDLSIDKCKSVGELDRKRSIVGYTFSFVYSGIAELGRYELVVVNINGESVSAASIGFDINKNSFRVFYESVLNGRKKKGE